MDGRKAGVLFLDVVNARLGVDFWEGNFKISLGNYFLPMGILSNPRQLFSSNQGASKAAVRRAFET
jgi:hypothetical protein